MAITSYLDIISVKRAKNYLRIDDELSEDDLEIASMIKAAFRFIERYTCHIFVQKSFTVYSNCNLLGQNAISVYNYPIVSTVPSDVKVIGNNASRTIYLANELTYTAGYASIEDVPDDFIQSALQMLKVFYYESEKQFNSTLIPISVTQVLDTYKRFV